MAEFKLDERECKLFDEWYTKHLIDNHYGEEPYGGAIGGVLRYEIVYTSIGQIVRAVCSICDVRKIENSRIDLSDYDSW